MTSLIPGPPPTVALACGRVVSSWSPEWRAETLARHWQVECLLRLDDRDARRAYVAKTAAAARASPPEGVTDRDAYAAQVRARLETEVLARWAARRAAPVPAPVS